MLLLSIIKINDAGLVGKIKGGQYEVIAAVEEPLKEGTANSGTNIPMEEILNSKNRSTWAFVAQ